MLTRDLVNIQGRKRKWRVRLSNVASTQTLILTFSDRDKDLVDEELASKINDRPTPHVYLNV